MFIVDKRCDSIGFFLTLLNSLEEGGIVYLHPMSFWKNRWWQFWAAIKWSFVCTFSCQSEMGAGRKASKGGHSIIQVLQMLLSKQTSCCWY